MAHVKGFGKKKSAEAKARAKPGGSGVGRYGGVKKFAGPAGGAPKGSFPINTLKRAKSALSYAHNAPNPAKLKASVYRAYPALAKRVAKREGRKTPDLSKIKGLGKK